MFHMCSPHSVQFWNKCTEQLQILTTDFNEHMNYKGFVLNFALVEKSPTGVLYQLEIVHKGIQLERIDNLVPTMVTASQIVANIKDLIASIQDLAD